MVHIKEIFTKINKNKCIHIFTYGARERKSLLCGFIFFAGASTDVFMCACMHVSIPSKENLESL